MLFFFFWKTGRFLFGGMEESDRSFWGGKVIVFLVWKSGRFLVVWKSGLFFFGDEKSDRFFLV